MERVIYIYCECVIGELSTVFFFNKVINVKKKCFEFYNSIFLYIFLYLEFVFGRDVAHDS